MPDQAAKLEVRLALDTDADADELDRLTAGPRRQLLELEVEDVNRPRTAIVGAVLDSVRSWLSRDEGRSAILRLDDDETHLTGISSEQQEQLIAVFVARHAEA